jgi:3-deoxy-D-manno-octulosonate 8-phosphate phosphatase (KDO 8-P phosphatase)
VKRIPVAVQRKAKKIKLLLLDVDGVLTDGRIIVDDRGVETKQFHVRDGQGISLLLRSGVDVGFVTGRSSKVVSRRAKELGVRIVRQGVQSKLDAYNVIRANSGLSDDQIAYMGDDVIDLAVLRRAGLAITVSDGWHGLKSSVDFVTASAGGRGAVREVAELLLIAQGNWSKLTAI